MKRTIQIETSLHDPRGRWCPGGQYCEADVTIEYPASLDHLSDDELDEMAADESIDSVVYVDQDGSNYWTQYYEQRG